MTVNPNILLAEALRTEIQRLRQLQQEASINRADFQNRAPDTLRELRGSN